MQRWRVSRQGSKINEHKSCKACNETKQLTESVQKQIINTQDKASNKMSVRSAENVAETIATIERANTNA